MGEYKVPLQPPELFVRKPTNDIPYPMFVLDTDRKPSAIECIGGKGMFVYRVGATYPEKGWPYREQIHAMDILKRIIVEFVGMCSNPLIALGLLFADKNRLMQRFNIIFDKAYALANFYEEQYLCDAARYFNKFLSSFLIDCGFNEEISREFSFKMSQIVEGDNAYRYRIQDLAGEFNEKENPRKELERLLNIYTERDTGRALVAKVKRMMGMVKLVLLIPKYRKAFVKNSYLIKYMKLDDADFYWADLTVVGSYDIKPMTNYDYRGKSWEERMNKEKPKKI